MRFPPVRARVALALTHPVAFLVVVNVACAILGLAQFAFSLTVLKPADFAVIGVLAAIGGVVTGLFDVKLADLTTKLYYAVPKGEPERRRALLTSSLLLHTVVGLCSAVLVFAAAWLLSTRFLASAPETWWIAVMAVRLASAYPLAALTTFLRLLGVFKTSGWLRLASQVASTLATIAALYASPDLAGYFAGAAAGVVLSLGLALAAVLPQILQGLGASLLRMPTREALLSFLASGSFLAGGSLAGISKLFSRSCDVLVVASLGNDTVTGLYRVARQGYDTLAGLTDAVHQFYTPTIVDCIARQQWAEFRKHRRRLMVIGVAAALAAILGSWLLLRPLTAAYYPHYGPALPAFEIFAGLLVVTLGIHGWLWPTLVASGRIWWFGVALLSGSALQLLAYLLLARLGWLTSESAATANWVAVMIAYGPFVCERIYRGATSSRL